MRLLHTQPSTFNSQPGPRYNPRMPPADLLDRTLADRLAADAAAWLRGKVDAVAGGDDRTLALSFGLAPRKTGKADLDPSADDLAAADDAVPGWDPSAWSVDQAARVRLLLAVPEGNRVAAFGRLLSAAEVGERVALFLALPLLPADDNLVDLAVDGLRTNVKGVFAAIVHRNPFPREHFSEPQWNQMVLKALFVGLPLAPVVGLHERMNDELRTMLNDYASERRAAGRAVPAELNELLKAPPA